MNKKNDEKRNENMAENKETVEIPPEPKQEENPNKEACEVSPESNADIQKMKDQYLRLMADYQNLQKRTAQEKEDLYK